MNHVDYGGGIRKARQRHERRWNPYGLGQGNQHELVERRKAFSSLEA
jgi:hypothetical protein